MEHTSLRVAERAFLLGTFALLLASCANLNTVGRINELPSPTYALAPGKANDGTLSNYIVTTAAPHGKAIHLDAPQRIVFSNALGQLCAEPAPDALQAYAASLGVSLTVPGKAADIAQALSASSAGIGLRTQSITLMRDSLYRICEAYVNKALTQIDVVQLLQRSQDLTLGVLAIEQLTGAVVARQPMLTPEASASAARNMLNKSVEALEAAKKSEADKKTAVANAVEARDKLKDTVSKDAEDDKAAKEKAKPVSDNVASLDKQLKAEDEALKPLDTDLVAAKTKQAKQQAKVKAVQDALDAATAKKDQGEMDKQTGLLAQEKAQLAKEDAAVAVAKIPFDKQKTARDETDAALKQAKADPALAAATKAAAKLSSDKESLGKAEAAIKDAEKDYKDAQAITEVRRAELANGTSAVDAVTKSGGLFSPAADRNNIDKDTAQALATATQAIVQSVLDKGHLVDSCLNMFAASALTNNALDAGIKTSCTDAISAYVKAYVAYNQAVKKELDEKSKGDQSDEGAGESKENVGTKDGKPKPGAKPAAKKDEPKPKKTLSVGKDLRPLR